MSRIACLVYLPLTILGMPFGYRYVVRAVPKSHPQDVIFVAMVHSYFTDPGAIRISSFERDTSLMTDYTDDQLKLDIEQEIRKKGRVY